MRTISEQIFETDVEINDSFEDTVYSNCTFKNNVFISNITSLRSFKFQECRINGSFFTVSVSYDDVVYIEAIDVKAYFVPYSGN